jgi:hypothetical protein
VEDDGEQHRFLLVQLLADGGGGGTSSCSHLQPARERWTTPRVHPTTGGGNEGGGGIRWWQRVCERREDGDGRSGFTEVTWMVDSGSYPKGLKGFDVRNIPFEIFFSLGLHVNCPKFGTSRESPEPPRCLS